MDIEDWEDELKLDVSLSNYAPELFGLSVVPDQSLLFGLSPIVTTSSTSSSVEEFDCDLEIESCEMETEDKPKQHMDINNNMKRTRSNEPRSHKKAHRPRKKTKIENTDDSDSKGSSDESNNPTAPRTASGRRRLKTPSKSFDEDSPSSVPLTKEERNRISASRYRARNKQYIQNLEDYVQVLTQFIQDNHLPVPKMASRLLVLCTLFLVSVPFVSHVYPEVSMVGQSSTSSVPGYLQENVRFGGGRKLLQFDGADEEEEDFESNRLHKHIYNDSSGSVVGELQKLFYELELNCTTSNLSPAIPTASVAIATVC